MKIVIVGDSYSTQRTIINGKRTHFTWIDCLEEEHEVSCLAVPGASNIETLEQVPDSDWDCIIASLSPLDRPGGKLFDQDQTKYQRQKEDRRHVKENISAAYKLTRLNRSIVWSSFPQYEFRPSVYYIPLEDENEYYRFRYKLSSLDYTGCHLTKKGNQKLAGIMKRLIAKL